MSSRSGVALLLALAAAACDRQSAVPEQANGASSGEVTAGEATAPARPAARAGAVDRSHRGAAAPATRLLGLDGAPTDLAAFRGQPVLVNLWATWCAPCVAELPSLDRASAGVVALAVNQGEEAAKIATFLAKAKLAHLRPLRDAEMAISMGLPANLPTTLLYDGQGREVWRVTGDRDWTTSGSRALIAEGVRAAPVAVERSAVGRSGGERSGAEPGADAGGAKERSRAHS